MPRLEKAEQLTPTKEYRFIRLWDDFGFEEIGPTVSRQHKDLAITMKLYQGKTPDGKPIVTDGGRMIAFADRIELAPDWTASIQVKAMIGFNYHQVRVEEAYDGIELAVRQQTARKLADLLRMPVTMKYQSVVRGSPLQEFTFAPR